VLEGRFVRLEPLCVRHAEDLAEAVDLDLFAYFAAPRPAEASPDAVRAYIATTTALPLVAFATVSCATGKAVGVTTYLDIRPVHRGLEVGMTWLGKAYQGTVVNPECKLLLLGHAFETLGAIRVQLKTDARNLQSQAAISKLGAVREGVLRSHYVMPDGYLRDTVMYAVTSDEWPAVKRNLEARIASF
jgi:N-acetyltransferase